MDREITKLFKTLPKKKLKFNKPTGHLFAAHYCDILKNMNLIVSIYAFLSYVQKYTILFLFPITRHKHDTTPVTYRTRYIFNNIILIIVR